MAFKYRKHNGGPDNCNGCAYFKQKKNVPCDKCIGGDWGSDRDYHSERVKKK
jgi:hypothetical protein